jgi:hypothetical protein
MKREKITALGRSKFICSDILGHIFVHFVYDSCMSVKGAKLQNIGKSIASKEHRWLFARLHNSPQLTSKGSSIRFPEQACRKPDTSWENIGERIENID